MKGETDNGLPFCFTKIAYPIFWGSMIYLTNTTAPQAVFVPRDTAICGGTLTFKATSTVELSRILDCVVLDLKSTKIYYNIALALPENATPGEYEYVMKSGDSVVSTGVLVVGEYTTDVAGEYDKPIQYEQYER